VIWQGRFHNTKPHLQHSCIGNFMQPVLNSFLRPFFVFGLFSPPPPPPLLFILKTSGWKEAFFVSYSFYVKPKNLKF
jgi:hypothetical protein